MTSRQKKMGAYYTDQPVADFLAKWAIRTRESRVLEPCFGGGVFLWAALDRLLTLGALNPQVVGVDLDDRAWGDARRVFREADLRHSDFFSIMPSDTGLFDAVIGNPPFVRYHHFAGAARKRALDRSSELGVEIPALTSAWAPFLVHAVSFLRCGGSLAMVVPFEITYAVYARPLVDFLGRSFNSIHCLMFDQPLFPDLSENTCLLLCEGFSGSTTEIALHRLGSFTDLEIPLVGEVQGVPVSAWRDGTLRTRAFDLDFRCRDLYARLVATPEVRRLGNIASVTIGYVTGDNDFFHLSTAEAAMFGIRPSDLRASVRRSADLQRVGLALTQTDIAGLTATGRHWLFYPAEPLDDAALDYVRNGEVARVHEAFKCRNRQPWFRVPAIRTPEMILSVLSAAGPRLVVNTAKATATNSVLVVDRISCCESTCLTIAASALTSLAQLSAEIEGHPLGGGALKFEPSEAKQWALPVGVHIDGNSHSDLDRLIRSGQFETAQRLADQLFLREGLGLSNEEIDILSQGLTHLRTSRTRK